MAYNINNTAGLVVFTIPERTTNTSSTVVLPGRYVNNWGEHVNESIYKLMENFACPQKASGPIAPQGSLELGAGAGIDNPVIGQLWFNTTTRKLYVYANTGSWESISVDASLPADILDQLKTVDGIGSGLDADLLDGLHANELASVLDAATLLTKIKTVDGVSSGLDADLLDGMHASDIIADALNSLSAAAILTALKTVDGTGSGLDADLLDGLHANQLASVLDAATLLTKIKTVDGDGSGLDADLLDGKHAAQIQAETIDAILQTGGVVGALFSWGLFSRS